MGSEMCIRDSNKETGIKMKSEIPLHYHSNREIINDNLGFLNKRSILEARKILVSKGFISEHNNPDNKFSFDRTIFYLVNTDKINTELSRQCSGYLLDVPSVQNAPMEQSETRRTITETILHETNIHKNINTRATPQKNDKYELMVEEILKTKTEDFKESFREYIKMRNKIKKPATAFALKNILNKIKAMTSDEIKQTAILNQSTDNSHQKIYELKDSTFGKVEVEKCVFITEDEEMELLNKYDSVFYGQMTDKLSDYKLQSGKTYFNDFTALNGWVLGECIKEWRAAGKKFEK